MWYAKINKPEKKKVKRLIQDALNKKGVTLDQLIDKMGYISRMHGRECLERAFNGEEDDLLLRRIGLKLEIDLELLTGEKSFTDKEEYLRFVFIPYIQRIPERTRPNQIFPVALMGINAFLRVGQYPDMLNAPLDERHRFVSNAIKSDYQKSSTTIFGPIIGYAFYYAFGEAQAYSTNGEVLPDLRVVPSSATCGLDIKSRPLFYSQGFIPRLVKHP